MYLHVGITNILFTNNVLLWLQQTQLAWKPKNTLQYVGSSQ